MTNNPHNLKRQAKSPMIQWLIGRCFFFFYPLFPPAEGGAGELQLPGRGSRLWGGALLPAEVSKDIAEEGRVAIQGFLGEKGQGKEASSERPRGGHAKAILVEDVCKGKPVKGCQTKAHGRLPLSSVFFWVAFVRLEKTKFGHIGYSKCSSRL